MTGPTPHGAVVLNKVVCGYFDPAPLLDNAVPSARRLRGDPFRTYVHDTAAP